MTKVRGSPFTMTERLANGEPIVLDKDPNHHGRSVTARLTLEAGEFGVMDLSASGGDYIPRGMLMWDVAHAPAEVSVDALRMDLLPGGRLYDAATRVVAGHRVEWDGRNWSNHLTPDAREAYTDLGDFLAPDKDRYVTGRELWDAGDWLFDAAPDELTGSENDEVLKALAAKWKAEALDDGVVLTGNVLRFLQGVRDEMVADSAPHAIEQWRGK